MFYFYRSIMYEIFVGEISFQECHNSQFLPFCIDPCSTMTTYLCFQCVTTLWTIYTSTTYASSLSDAMRNGITTVSFRAHTFYWSVNVSVRSDYLSSLTNYFSDKIGSCCIGVTTGTNPTYTSSLLYIIRYRVTNVSSGAHTFYRSVGILIFFYYFTSLIIYS